MEPGTRKSRALSDSGGSGDLETRGADRRIVETGSPQRDKHEPIQCGDLLTLGEVLIEAGPRRQMQGDQASLPKFGLAYEQSIGAQVVQLERQGFGNSETARKQ